VVHLLDSLHEGAHTHEITLVSQLLGAVVHCVEFAHFVLVPDPLEQSLNFLPGPGHLEIVLRDPHLREGRREEEVNCFWLIAVVLVVSHRPLLLVGDVSSDGRGSEDSVLVLWFPHSVSSTRFDCLAEVTVWL